eukprot:9333316-Alexandrium_andersonii.AAC.1
MAEYHCSRVRPGITMSSGSAPTKRTLSAVTWRGHQTRFCALRRAAPRLAIARTTYAGERIERAIRSPGRA